MFDIRKDLPNTPIEVIDIWLKPLSKRPDVGWPPSKMNSWRYILGEERDFDYLKKLSWSKEIIKLTPYSIVPRDLLIINQLFKSHVLGEQTLLSSCMKDGLERFLCCKKHIMETGKFPEPVIIEKLGNKYHIFDGYHRVTSFLYLYGYFKIDSPEVPCPNVDINQEYWVAVKR